MSEDIKIFIGQTGISIVCLIQLRQVPGVGVVSSSSADRMRLSMNFPRGGKKDKLSSPFLPFS